MSTPQPCRCGRAKTESWHLLCVKCWKKLPKPLQDEVYATWKEKAGSPRHVAAMRACIEYLRSLTFGWEVDVEFMRSSGKPPQTFHYRGCTEAAARRKVIFKPNFERVVAVRPVTEDEWVRAYGIGGRM